MALLNILPSIRGGLGHDHHFCSLSKRGHLEESAKADKQCAIYLKVERWQQRVPRLEPHANGLERSVQVVDLRTGTKRLRERDVPNPVLAKEKAVIENNVYASL